MKKINIIKKSTDFEKIIKNNKSLRSKYFYIYIEKSEEKKIYRFGLSVGKVDKVVFAILDKNFADKIMQLFNESKGAIN